MSGQKPQIDYDALADQARKQATSAVPVPKNAAQPTAVDYDALAAQARQAQVPAPPAPTVAAPAPQEGFWASAVSPFVGMAQGLKSAVYEGPQNPTEAAIVGGQPGVSLWDDATPIIGRAVLAAKRMLVDPQIDQGKQAASAFKQAAPLSLHPTPGQLEQRQLALGHGLAAAIPMLGPWAANVGEKEGEQLAAGNYLGATGTAFGNAALALAPKGISKMAGAAPEAAQGLVRVATGTGTGPVKELVKQRRIANAGIDEANAAADKAHAGNTQDALHEQRGREIEYQIAVDSKTQEIAQADQSEAGQLAAKQSAAERKVTAANEAIRAKHQAVAQKVADANRAAENALELRRQLEQTYQKATADHYAKEQATDTQAKAEENTAWQGWRQKTAGKTLDGGLIAEPLQKLRLDSPEVDRTLNQLEPRGDEVPQESPYTQIRAQAAQKQFGKDYESLIPVKQDEIDDLLHSSGYSPEPIAFDPQAGQPISIDRVQRASSILQRYIRSGRFEGPLLGEMKQVAKVLRNAVTRASADAGATPELDAARNSTVTYQNAFGRERNMPATARTIREKQLNPEAFQERADEERLAKARRYDPTLVDSYRQVKAARKALDSLSPEDQIRKRLRQVPPPPTVNDPRPGFRLTAPPQRTPARPASGSPAERAFQSVDQPSRPNFPDRPIPDPHQTISAGDIAAAKRAAVEASAGKWWTRGRWAAAAPIIWAMRGFFGGHIPSIPMAGAESGGILAATHVGVSLLRYPPLVDFLVKARPKDVAVIPLELRGDLPGLVSQAQRQGIKVSPALLAATGGALAAQKKEGPQGLQLPIPVAQALQAMQPTFSQGATQ
jgi:hypothetical protein